MLNLGHVALAVALAADPPTPERKDWLSGWREATVALGQLREAKSKTGTQRWFSAVGTGVLLGLPDDPNRILWLVTAKHVFEDGDWRPESLRLRFAWFADRSVYEHHGIQVQLRDKNERLWFAHPDGAVDLACIPLRITRTAAERENVNAPVFGDFATSDEIFAGAQVLILGYPGALEPTFWRDALVRAGVIAWVDPKEPVAQPLLVDSDLLPGNSGGPVFRVPGGMDRFGNLVVGGRASFLGIVSRGPLQAMPVTAGGKPITMQPPANPNTSSSPVPLLTDNLTGIAVIEPAARVRILLEAAAKAMAR